MLGKRNSPPQPVQILESNLEVLNDPQNVCALYPSKFTSAIQSRELLAQSHKELYTGMFSASLFVIVKGLGQIRGSMFWGMDK